MTTAAININRKGEITEQAGDASGLTAERIDVGLYQVNGAVELDASRWSVSLPQDMNGQNLVTFGVVESENGLRFCIRDLEFNPVDIPEGKVISLRVIV